MPLDLEGLQASIMSIVDPLSGPETTREAARSWSRAYHKYASEGLATTLVPTASHLTIEGAINSSDDFLVGLAAGIEAYWLSTVWASPGFTGVSVLVPGALLVALRGVGLLNMSPSTDARAAASRLASAMHTYTKTVSVTVTNVTTGVTAIATVT